MKGVTAPASTAGSAAAPVPAANGSTVQPLRRASELIGARRLPEAEAEILHALVAAPKDLRALKMLALVRFRLGRLADARDSYREAAQIAPEDASVRLSLGLIGIKLDWFEEAAQELDAATRLRPDDLRAWSYLGYAHARLGAFGKAAAAFRRAGQPEVAVELERGQAVPSQVASTGDVLAALVGGPRTVVSAAAHTIAGPTPESSAAPVSLTGFAFSRLLPVGKNATELVAVAEGVLRFGVRDDAYVRQSALLASVGALDTEAACRRRHGRLTMEPLGGHDALFVRYRGNGDLWLASPPAGRALVPFSLDQDALYLREDRVVAFDGDVVWESGSIPWDGIGLLQFRGSGRVVMDAAVGDVVALRVPEAQIVTVARRRLIGWMGRVVPQSVRGADWSRSAPQIACEGEGVLLLSKHGELAQPIHERTEPGHDGPGAPDSGRSNLYR